MKKHEHEVHKYYRAELGKNKQYIVYKCILPNCTHFVPRALLVGRKSICWRCGNVFVIAVNHLWLKKPHCNACKVSRITKEKIKKDTTMEKFIQLLTGTENK